MESAQPDGGGSRVVMVLDLIMAQTHTLRADIIEQIIRDEAVLAGDPIYHQPSADFYIDRILVFRAWLQQLDEEEENRGG